MLFRKKRISLHSNFPIVGANANKVSKWVNDNLGKTKHLSSILELHNDMIVIKLDMANRLNVEYPEELDNLVFMLEMINDVTIKKSIIVDTLTIHFNNNSSIIFNCWGGTKLMNDILEAKDLDK
ncbi:hypothetical protein N9E52_02695 [Alphaproteobacteria bacterium]|jgi:hypothetical protein|nr:hypothetical protein [Alphaproteobacteria bacterium]MDB0034031.1 hypothetical protein [Alphaproteobacteria bacterium]